MPTYVYGCDACGHRFEQFQKFADEPLKVCPNCGKAVRRIMQPAGIVFKGSGWHITAYKRSGSGNGGESGNGDGTGNTGKDSGGKSNGATAESGKADAKPAEKSEKADSAASASGDGNKPAQAAS